MARRLLVDTRLTRRVGRFQVKVLKYSDLVRVNVPFSTTEDEAAVESQLSDISGFRVMSLAGNVINSYADGRWRTEMTLVVYAVDNTNGSVVPASNLER